MRAFSQSVWIALGVTASAAAMAQDVGRVISTQPIQQQIASPRQVCNTEQVAVQPQKSGAGAVLGAVAGGAVGNTIGRGGGNAAATMLGIVGGAMLGDRIEGAPPVQMQTVQNCRTQTFFENRTVAYNVVYEFGGKQYSVQMPNDPGPNIPLQVSPVGAPQTNLSQANPGNAQPSYQQPAYQQPTYQQPVYQQPVYQQPVYQQPVVVQSAVYPVYVTQPYYAPRYYPPVSLNFGWGFHGGDHHEHWR
jgi:uncharacterized protein YcfJ